MDRVLIVSSNEKAIDSLCSLLKVYNDIQIITTSSASKARRYASNNEVSVAIINTPLREEFGNRLSLDLSDMNIGTLLLVKNAMVDQVSSDVEMAGVLIVPKPIVKSLFYQFFKIQLSVKKRILSLKKENDKLKDRLEEIKLVDRAKLTLIEKRNISENDAHKYIEIEAMNRRVARSVIAKEILDKYDIS